MKQEHKYAQALRWLADGERVEIQWGTNPCWYSLKDRNEVVNDEIMRGYADYRFRIKPKTIRIGDREIEAPVMSGPGYYLTLHGDVFRWFNEPGLNPQIDMQKRGLVFATEDAARAAQEAITALLTQEPK